MTRFDRKDKRFQLFPDDAPVEPEYYDTVYTDLLGKVKRIVREAHEGLIATAEVFYKQKVRQTLCVCILVCQELSVYVYTCQCCLCGAVLLVSQRVSMCQSVGVSQCHTVF